MRCPFCAEDVRDDASVCRHCGNDVKIPASLIAENSDLKERAATLQRQLEELYRQLAFRKERTVAKK